MDANYCILSGHLLFFVIVKVILTISVKIINNYWKFSFKIYFWFVSYCHYIMTLSLLKRLKGKSRWRFGSGSWSINKIYTFDFFIILVHLIRKSYSNNIHYAIWKNNISLKLLLFFVLIIKLVYVFIIIILYQIYNNFLKSNFNVFTPYALYRKTIYLCIWSEFNLYTVIYSVRD